MMTEHRVVYCVAFGVAVLFTLFQFISPFILENNAYPSVYYDHIDPVEVQDAGFFGDIAVWTYNVGKITCHQITERSFVLNGNQMPICSRCLGIYIGIMLILGIGVLINPKGDFFRSLQYFIPTSLKRVGNVNSILLIIGSLLIVPMIFDGLLQYFTVYESTNVIRFFTGFLFGIVEGGFIIGVLAWLINSIFVADVNLMNNR